MVTLDPSKVSSRVRIPAVAKNPPKRSRKLAFGPFTEVDSMRKKGKAFVKEIALERIYRLFELAEKEFGKGNSELANRYVGLARKISSRNKATIPTDLKGKFCKKCHRFLKKGKNAELKKTDRWLEVKCGECGASFKRRM